MTDFVASGSFAALRENVKYYDSPNYAVLVRTKDLSNNFSKDLVYTDIHGYTFLSNSNLFGGELILPNIGASIGKVFIMPKLEHLTTLAPNSIMLRCWDEVTLKWLYYFFCSGIGQNTLKFISSSTAQGKFNKTDFKRIRIPIPPLEEQNRVVNHVSSVEELLQVLESEEANLDKHIKLAKAKILDLAMRGKLVLQDPADEPAADMLRRVNPKAKIITDNPHSWNIPNGWCITDLKSIGKWQSGATPSKMNPKYYGKGYPWLNTGDLNDGYISIIPKEITELALNETSVKLNPAGSILIAIYGATIGKLGILTCESTTNQACCACADCYIFNMFLFYFLKYHRTVFIKIGGGGAQPNISKEKIEKTILCLPPLNEQMRIVAKIEELYFVLDEIEASLRS